MSDIEILAAANFGKAFVLERENERLHAALRAACPFCADNFGKMMPPHTPSKNCESGKRPHCTCSVCF